jgi:hypothetical protein
VFWGFSFVIITKYLQRLFSAFRNKGMDKGKESRLWSWQTLLIAVWFQGKVP